MTDFCSGIWSLTGKILEITGSCESCATDLSISPVALIQALTVLLFFGCFHVTKFGQSVRQTRVVQARNIKQVSINITDHNFFLHVSTSQDYCSVPLLFLVVCCCTVVGFFVCVYMWVGGLGGGGECKFLNGNAAAFLIWFQLQSGDWVSFSRRRDVVWDIWSKTGGPFRHVCMQKFDDTFILFYFLFNSWR